jgi:hypothetical protein
MKRNTACQFWIAPAVMAGVLSVLIAGCASQPPPKPPPPGAQAFPMPPALTPDEMAKLCQAAPDTCHHVQLGQPLTLGDVKAMTKVGFSSEVIIGEVRGSRTVFHLMANQILDLKNAGVADAVIDFLLNTPNAIAGTMPVPEPTVNPYPAGQTPPPPPPDEVQPVSPGADYVWVGGDWVWNGGWVWVGGHWAFPPFHGAIWYHGGWRRGWNGNFRRDHGYWH